MKSKNVKVGPLSAVSPKTLRSVYRVLMWHMDNCVGGVGIRNKPTEEDELAALEFALTVRLATNPMEGGAS